jgi:hypothetical protein
MGRSPYCSIVLSNSRASRQHCAIIWDEHGLTLSDLGSSNGTYLNGTRLSKRISLQAGDVLSVGGDMLEIVEEHRNASVGVARTEQGPGAAIECDEFDEAQSTKRQEMTLDVIEAIASTAAGDGLSNRVATSVMRAVDAFLTSLSASGARLVPAQAARLAAITELVGAREGNAGFIAWKHRTIERISRDAMFEEPV